MQPVLFLSCICYAFVRVSLLMHCGHLLGKGWPLGSRLWSLIVSLSLSHWYPGSGVVLDCIDSWSLPSFLLNWLSGFWNFYVHFLSGKYCLNAFQAAIVLRCIQHHGLTVCSFWQWWWKGWGKVLLGSLGSTLLFLMLLDLEP